MSIIVTQEALRSLYNPIGERSQKKELPRLDEHITRFVSLSPFVVISSSEASSGAHDASPRGGEPGFVKVVDASTLLLPDAPGNNRLDTLENIVSHGEGGAPEEAVQTRALGAWSLVHGLAMLILDRQVPGVGVDPAEAAAVAREVLLGF